MPHIHKLIDFTVGAFIVYKQKVLLVNHKKLKQWLPVGGHIELDEDLEEALFREIREESGLKRSDITVVEKKNAIYDSEGRKALFNPVFTDIHRISRTHRHIGFGYVIKAKTDKVTLAKREHHAIKWFKKSELSSPKYKINPAIRYYAKEALRLAK